MMKNIEGTIENTEVCLAGFKYTNTERTELSIENTEVCLAVESIKNVSQHWTKGVQQNLDFSPFEELLSKKEEIYNKNLKKVVDEVLKNKEVVEYLSKPLKDSCSFNIDRRNYIRENVLVPYIKGELTSIPKEAFSMLGTSSFNASVLEALIYSMEEYKYEQRYTEGIFVLLKKAVNSLFGHHLKEPVNTFWWLSNVLFGDLGTISTKEWIYRYNIPFFIEYGGGTAKVKSTLTVLKSVRMSLNHKLVQLVKLPHLSSRAGIIGGKWYCGHSQWQKIPNTILHIEKNYFIKFI